MHYCITKQFLTLPKTHSVLRLVISLWKLRSVHVRVYKVSWECSTIFLSDRSKRKWSNIVLSWTDDCLDLTVTDAWCSQWPSVYSSYPLFLLVQTGCHCSPPPVGHLVQILYFTQTLVYHEDKGIMCFRSIDNIAHIQTMQRPKIRISIIIQSCLTHVFWSTDCTQII